MVAEVMAVVAGMAVVAVVAGMVDRMRIGCSMHRPTQTIRSSLRYHTLIPESSCTSLRHRLSSQRNNTHCFEPLPQFWTPDQHTRQPDRQ